MDSKSRLNVIDGFRAIAVLGVLYIHCWNAFSHPSFTIKGFSLAKPLALGGDGVDLFFVISGFLMYFIYGVAPFNGVNYFKRRWVRLSPPFYIATIVYIIFEFYYHHDFPVIKSLFTSIFYLNNIFTQYSSAALFWTLGLEIQFYLFFIVFMYAQKKIGFIRSCILISLFFVSICTFLILVYKSDSDKFTNQVCFRYFEFLAGMITARFFLLKDPKVLNAFYFIPCIVVIYVGRFLTSGYAILLSTDYGSFIKLTGFIIMGLGFSGILYVALSQKEWLLRVFNYSGLISLGKVSYSFYLWHGIILAITIGYIVQLNMLASYKVILSFIVSSLITALISKFSFKYIEAPFLK